MTLPPKDKFNTNNLNDHDLLVLIAGGYDLALSRHGTSPKGVMWSEEEAQISRFRVLSSIIKPRKNISINDYGCGFGAFFVFLEQQKLIDETTAYYGYDISMKMLKEMKYLHQNDSRITAILNNKITTVADYSFSSGTFGLKLETDNERWKKLVKESITELNKNSKLGFAFNILDINGLRPKQNGLFYGERQEFLSFCKEHFSGEINLISGYYPDDFTITVVKK